MNNTLFESWYCRLCGDPASESEAVDILQDATLKFIIQVRLQIKVCKLIFHSCLNTSNVS
jgi:hypothetical protein